MPESVGFIGLGIMGTPMTRNLMKAGFRAVVYNRTRAKAEQLAAEGAEAVESPAEVARRADVVITCLADAKAVEQVVTEDGGLLEAMGPGKVLIDMTTNSPPISQKLRGRT